MKNTIKAALAFSSVVIGIQSTHAEPEVLGLKTRTYQVQQNQDANSKAREATAKAAVNARKISPEAAARAKKELMKLLDAQAKGLAQAMGNDKVAMLAVNTILSKMAGKSAPDNLENVCQTQATCDMPMAEFYSKAVSKIPAKQFGNARVYLQRAMMSSDLAPESKAEILRSSIYSKETLQNLTPTDFPGGIPKLGQDANLVINTHAQILSLKLEPEAAFKMTAKVVHASSDVMTNLILENNLATVYPQYKLEFRNRFERMGAIKRPTK